MTAFPQVHKTQKHGPFCMSEPSTVNVYAILYRMENLCPKAEFSWTWTYSANTCKDYANRLMDKWKWGVGSYNSISSHTYHFGDVRKVNTAYPVLEQY